MFVGVTLYAVMFDVTEGVPVIAQVVVLKDRPAGSVDGVMAQAVMGEVPLAHVTELAEMLTALAG